MSKRGQWESQTRRMRTHYQSGNEVAGETSLEGLFLTPFRLFSRVNERLGCWTSYPGSTFSMRGSRQGAIPWTVIDSNTISVHSAPLIMDASADVTGTYHNAIRIESGRAVISDLDIWNYPYNNEPPSLTEAIYVRLAYIIRWYICKSGSPSSMLSPITWNLNPGIDGLDFPTLSQYNPLRINFSGSATVSMNTFVNAARSTRITFNGGVNENKLCVAYKSPFANDGFNDPPFLTPGGLYQGTLTDSAANPTRYYGIISGVKDADVNTQYDIGNDETFTSSEAGVYFTSGEQPEGWSAFQPECRIYGIRRPVLAVSTHIRPFTESGFQTNTNRAFIKDGKLVIIN